MFSQDLLNGIYLITFVIVFVQGMKIYDPKKDNSTIGKIATLLAIITTTFILNLGTYGIYLVITSLSQYF